MLVAAAGLSHIMRTLTPMHLAPHFTIHRALCSAAPATQAMLQYACDGVRDLSLFPDNLRLTQPHGADEPLPLRPPAVSSAHGDTHSAAADDTRPDSCLLSRLGLTVAQPRLGRTEWSSLPDEPFGVLAHWPLAEHFVPAAAADELSSTSGAFIGSVAFGASGGQARGMGSAHLLATRVASALLVLCTVSAALAYLFMRMRGLRSQRGGSRHRKHRSNSLNRTSLVANSKDRQRGGSSVAWPQHDRLHAV